MSGGWEGSHVTSKTPRTRALTPRSATTRPSVSTRRPQRLPSGLPTKAVSLHGDTYGGPASLGPASPGPASATGGAGRSSSSQAASAIEARRRSGARGGRIGECSHVRRSGGRGQGARAGRCVRATMGCGNAAVTAARVAPTVWPRRQPRGDAHHGYRALEHRHLPLHRGVRGPTPRRHQGPRPLRQVERPDRHRSRRRHQVIGLRDPRGREHRHARGAARRPPQVARFPRRGEVPTDHLRFQEGREGRERFEGHRRPDDPRRDEGGHPPGREPRDEQGSLGQHPRPLRGEDAHQPQGLRPRVEPGARDGRRAGEREDRDRDSRCRPSRPPDLPLPHPSSSTAAGASAPSATRIQTAVCSPS